MFTLLTVFCAANSFASCQTLVLNSRMTYEECTKQVNEGIENVLMSDGKWYSAKGIKFTCVPEA